MSCYRQSKTLGVYFFSLYLYVQSKHYKLIDTESEKEKYLVSILALKYSDKY